MDEVSIRRFMRRFEGFDKAYGSYDPSSTFSSEGGKVEIKATAFTKRIDKITFDFWEKHINGEKPLGIIPIRDNNTCLWGCIDVDDYNLDIPVILQRIKAAELPFIVCGTKSGGLHLFLFTVEPVSAAVMQLQLREMAASLGLAGSEIFPKQTKVNLEKGDLGNWLNMPYFGDTRWAYRQDGSVMDLGEFLNLADSLEQPVIWLTNGSFKKKQTKAGNGHSYQGKGAPDFQDGPPCLQHLSAIGLEEGSRNNGIFAMGVFAKKKYHTNWKEVLDKWNHDFVNPPLSSDDMSDISKRLAKKDYNYKCSDQPIASHCNSALCQTRRYGVGDDAIPALSGLSRLGHDENAIWFLNIETRFGAQRIELTLEQLTNYKSFQRACVSQHNIYPRDMKQSDWGKILTSLLNDVTEIEISEEVSIKGQFTELLSDFVKDTNRGEQRDDLLSQRPWLDDEHTENGKLCPRHYFRLRDLQKFLEEANFKASREQIVTRIRALGGERHFFKIKEEGVRVWWVPEDFTSRKVEGPLKTPPLQPNPI